MIIRRQQIISHLNSNRNVLQTHFLIVRENTQSKKEKKMQASKLF